MAPPKFKDLGKQAGDTLCDDDKYESKCEIKSKVKGINLTSTFTGNTNTGELGKAYIKGTLEAKGKYMDSDISLKFTDGGEATVKAENAALVKNLKLTAEYTVGKAPKLSGEYKHDMAFLTGAYDVSKKALDVTVSFGANGISGGLSHKLDLSGKSTGKNIPDFKTTYATKTLELTAFCNKGGKDAGVSAMNKVSDTMAVAVNVSQTKTDKTELGIALGGSYTLDDATDISATVSNAGNIHALCEAKISPALKIKASGMVNTKDLANMKAHKWGLQMLYSL